MSGYEVAWDDDGLGVEYADVVAESGMFALVEVGTRTKYPQPSGASSGVTCEVILARGAKAATVKITAKDGRERITVTEASLRYGVFIAVCPDYSDWDTREYAANVEEMLHA